MSVTPVKGLSGQVDIFAKITGTQQGVLKGESQAAGHVNQIEVQSFSWEVMQPTDTATGVAAGRRHYAPFVFLIYTHTASAQLMRAAMSGEHLKEVIIYCRKAGKEQQEYLVYKLGTCIISKFESGYMTDNQIIPMDRVSLVFRKFECTVKMQNPDGTLGGGFTAEDELGSH
jgi:type VI secretion system secreted protein Hcp